MFMQQVRWIRAAPCLLLAAATAGVTDAVRLNNGGGLQVRSAAAVQRGAEQPPRWEPLQADEVANVIGLSGHADTSLQLLDTCDVVSDGPICFSERKAALMPPAVPHGLIGHWSFDERSAFDSSGNMNHGDTEFYHGPSPAGSGHSAIFHKNFLMVPNSHAFQVEDFSYSFWVYLLPNAAPADESPRWCPLLRKGVYVAQAQEFANAPAILFSFRTGRVRASVTTNTSSRGDGEFVDSNARLVPGRWAHVAVVHHAKRGNLLIYINGILDSTAKTRGSLVLNDYPLYIGGDPFTAGQCDHMIYMDELRAYGRAVSPHEVQAEAAPALGGLDPSFVHLGCLSCSLEEAIRSCPRGRTICSSLELHTGGYQVARSLGWLDAGTHVWTEAAVMKGRQQASDSILGPPLKGLGLCCVSNA
mmetsp:Transcript_66457/g.131070  ORF Transcript_66457/g.131070 Transcript_66457/m.131070 type:complete len:416 (-) Transcript_66457:46-1293(-)